MAHLGQDKRDVLRAHGLQDWLEQHQQDYASTKEAQAAFEATKPCNCKGKWCKKAPFRVKWYDNGQEKNKKFKTATAAKNFKTSVEAGTYQEPGKVTVTELCEAFVDFKTHDPDITSVRTVKDYVKTANLLKAVFNKHRRVETLNPMDFVKLDRYLKRKWGPTTRSNEITRIKVLFNFAVAHRLIGHLPDGLDVLKKPKKKEIKIARNGKPKTFTAEQIRVLLDKANPQLHAMILLGINCALGDKEVADLEAKHIDKSRQLLIYPRNKTGEWRYAIIWDETLRALDKVGLPFRTTHGNKWVREQPQDNALSKEFHKLKDKCHINTQGLNYYGLRHTFNTRADSSGEPILKSLVMGHSRDGMDAIYTHLDDHNSEDWKQEVEPRLQTISDYMHTWLFGETT